MEQDKYDRMFLQQVVKQVEKAVIGRRKIIAQLIKAMLSGGHVLLEDVPGLGKTLLVRAMAKAMDGDFKRIQFTSDLMPTDITGLHIWDRSLSEFTFRKGPLFAHIVLADEINRASPKTQSALLEAMEERRVTEGGQTFELPEPFFLLATQNPEDHHGTHTLPEAQMDRFLFRIHLGYPSCEDEAEMLRRSWGTGDSQELLKQIRPVLAREEWMEMRRRTANVYVDPVIFRYVSELSAAARKHPRIERGPSPRASLALIRASQAEAFWQGREYVLPDDVLYMLKEVWGHRIVLQPDARDVTVAEMVVDLQRMVDVPGRPDLPDLSSVVEKAKTSRKPKSQMKRYGFGMVK